MSSLSEAKDLCNFFAGDCVRRKEKGASRQACAFCIIPLVIVWHIDYTYYDMIFNFILGLE
jgi:hypothetical protein